MAHGDMVCGAPSGNAVMLDTPELLRRLSRSFREEIGPAVVGDYAKTQAFMAAVILDKVAREVATAAEHAAAEHADLATFHEYLAVALAAPTIPVSLRNAAAAARGAMTAGALGPFIEALYGAKAELGDSEFNGILTNVRAILRSRLDRQMVSAA